MTNQYYNKELMCCPKCGCQITDNAVFCSKCGAKLNNSINNNKQTIIKKTAIYSIIFILLFGVVYSNITLFTPIEKREYVNNNSVNIEINFSEYRGKIKTFYSNAVSDELSSIVCQPNYSCYKTQCIKIPKNEDWIITSAVTGMSPYYVPFQYTTKSYQELRVFIFVNEDKKGKMIDKLENFLIKGGSSICFGIFKPNMSDYSETTVSTVIKARINKKE